MAIEFDGTTQYINCGSGASIDDIATISIAAWCYFDAFDFRRIVHKNVAGATAGWLLNHPNTARLQWYRSFSGNDGYWYSPVDSLSTGKWIHVGVTYNKGATGNAPVFYVDGALVATTLGGAPTGTADSEAAQDLLIGANPGPGNLFDGKMEDVRVANVIWTAEQFAALAAGYRGPLGGEVMWLDMCRAHGVGHWDGSTLTVDTHYLPDGSVNENTGNPTGDPVARASDCPRMGVTI